MQFSMNQGIQTVAIEGSAYNISGQLKVQTKIFQIANAKINCFHENAAESRLYYKGTGLEDMKLWNGLQGYLLFTLAAVDEYNLPLSQAATDMVRDSGSATVD